MQDGNFDQMILGGLREVFELPGVTSADAHHLLEESWVS